MLFTIYLAVILLSIIGWEIGKAVSRRIRMPYTWKCPKCDFKVSSNTRDVYEISKSSHNHISTEEYK